MGDQLTDNEFNQWFSTYGVITSQRILGYYQVSLSSKELLPAIKNTTSFYHRLIQVPLKNVLNGIIFQQSNDYHIYSQKLFIDYLLSGESGKPPESQGASIRDILEEERQALITLGDQFNQKQLEHDALISLSQKTLIKLTKEFKEQFNSGANLIYRVFSLNEMDVSKILIKASINYALINCPTEAQEIKKELFIEKMKEMLDSSIGADLTTQFQQELSSFFEVLLGINSKIEEYLEKVAKITKEARVFRAQFYDSALRIVDLINMLPEYKINAEQDAINKESLYFDKSIGEAGKLAH